MSPVNISPHSSAHSRGSSRQWPTLPSQPGIWSFTSWGLETFSWLSSRSLDRPTPQWHWICLPTSEGRPFCGATMVEQHNSPTWLCDNDNNDESTCTITSYTTQFPYHNESFWMAVEDLLQCWCLKTLRHKVTKAGNTICSRGNH